MHVRGIEGLTLSELIAEVRQGGRFVVFRTCVGLGVAAVCRTSAVRFVRPGERVRGHTWWRSAVTAVFGWWAIPWGPSRALAALRANRRGGDDVTAPVLKRLAEAEARGLGLTDFPRPAPRGPRPAIRPHAA